MISFNSLNECTIFSVSEHDYPPYRAVGPVTVDEYESRGDRYDQQLKVEVGVDPNSLSTEEKMEQLREYRQNRYEKLVDAVYNRRGWDENGIPTIDKLQELGIDFPDVVDLVQKYS
jgi:aldehyde:ferredoxin oxidoreductase